MLGQGPTFADFGDANGYCSNRLSLAVSWLIGNPNLSYRRPDPAVSMCELRQGVLPLYILYSNGQNIDIPRSREIASILATQGRYVSQARFTSGPVGPAIITTEIDFNRSQVQQIKDQINAIYEGCGNTQTDHRCLIAVAPKINDYESLDLVLNDPTVNSRVDLVAFGINSNYIDVGSSCTIPSGDVMEQTVRFASYALYNKSKPSVIPYIMIDAKGSDFDHSCNWTEGAMIDTYSALMQRGVLYLPQKGVIGMAPYAFNNTQYGGLNPLNCKDCALGKNSARMRSWFGGCQAYTNITSRTPTGTLRSTPTPGTLLVFGNTSGTYCEQGTDASFVFSGLTFGSGAVDRDFTAPQSANYNASLNNSILRCDSCATTQFGSPQDFGFNFGTIGGSADQLTLGCNAYPEIDRFASMRGLDPNLIRAFITSESGFNKCEVARVCRRGYNGAGPDGRACFDGDVNTNDECYGKAFNAMYDPDFENGIASAGGPRTTNSTLSCPIASDLSGANPINWQMCAFGLMQVTEPPYTFWPSNISANGVNGIHWDVTAELLSRSHISSLGAMENSRFTCGDHFNPFNVTDNLCWGTAKLSANLDAARADVERYHRLNYANWDPNTLEGAEKDRIFSAYIAANKYSGTWDQQLFAQNFPFCGTEADGDCMMRFFVQSRGVDAAFCTVSRGGSIPRPECATNGVPNYEECYGFDDPVELMSCLLQKYAPQGYTRDRGAGKMRNYYTYRNQCPNSNCPANRQLLVATGNADLTNNPGFSPQDTIDGTSLPR